MSYAVMIYVVKCADLDAMAKLPVPDGAKSVAQFAADPWEVGAALNMAASVMRTGLSSDGFIPPQS